MTMVYGLIYFYLLLKPFYLFQSGSIQISDIFLILAFLFLLIVDKNKIERNINKAIFKNKHFVIFISFVIIINGFYFAIYGNTKFLLSSLYFVFNFIAVITFYICYKNEKFLSNILKIFKTNIVIQLFIFILGIGRFYDHERYMGTFNDPNQFGYFILISYMFVFLLSEQNKNIKDTFLYLIISIYLIFQCASTSMLLGITTFLILDILYNLPKFLRLLKRNINKILVSTFVLLFIFTLFQLGLDFGMRDEISRFTSNLIIVERVKDKLNRVDSETENQGNLFEERGYDKIYFYPEKILYGAGEGMYDRFSKSYHNNEIHATFPSILFYYGIIPTLILLGWFLRNIKGVSVRILIVYIALLLESFTLLNQRQALFWIIILFGSYLKEKKEKKLYENIIYSHCRKSKN